MTRLSNLWATGTTRARELASGPIARASGLSLGIRVSGLLLSFAQAILTARLLGPAGYGTVATVLSSAQILATTVAFGLGSLAVREVPRRRSAGEEGSLAQFLSHSGKLVIVMSSLLAGFAIIIAVPQLENGNPTAIFVVVGSLLTIPLAIIALLRGWAQGFGRIFNAQFPAEVLRPFILIATMGSAILLNWKYGVFDYLISAILAALVALVFSFAMIWRSDLRKLPAPANSPRMRETVTLSLPFLGLGLASMLQGEVNTIMLAAMAGPRETGLFQPIARLAPLLALPAQAAGMRYAPRIAELWHAGDHEGIHSVTRTFTLTTSLLTLLLGLAVAGAGPWLMIAFGREFGASASLLWIVAAAQIINAAGGPLGIIFAMVGRTGVAVAGQVAGLAVNLLIGVIFIPTLGATAAALGILAATITWNIVLVVLMRRQIGLDPSLLGFFLRTHKNSAT